MWLFFFYARELTLDDNSGSFRLEETLMWKLTDFQTSKYRELVKFKQVWGNNVKLSSFCFIWLRCLIVKQFQTTEICCQPLSATVFIKRKNILFPFFKNRLKSQTVGQSFKLSFMKDSSYLLAPSYLETRLIDDYGPCTLKIVSNILESSRIWFFLCANL